MFYEECSMLYRGFMQERSKIYVPEQYENIATQVAEKIGWSALIVPVKKEGRHIEVKETNKIMIGFSSGLDSAYLLHKCKEKGLDVIAFHVSGLNKSFASVEERQAKKIARMAGAKYVEAEFKAPKQAFKDNPFKNQLILSMMLDYGVKNDCRLYGLGSDWTTPLGESAVGFTITDSREVNEEYWKGVQESFPSAELVFIPDCDKKIDRLVYLFDNHRKTLENISSCVTPIRYREHLHKHNETKYGVKLMSGRCGSCYKCSMEYILLCHAGKIEKNEQYLSHCWDVLATSKNSHRPDLFDKSLPKEKRLENLLNYGS